MMNAKLTNFSEKTRRSASPRSRSHSRSRSRSNSPSSSTLPTRTRPDTTKKPISFKVNPNDRDRSQNPDDRAPSPKRRPEDDAAADDDEPMVEDEDDDMAAMQAMMGFGAFGSTKGKKIAGNNTGGVVKEKKTEYRQYMNRQGGFNRPLSPSR